MGAELDKATQAIINEFLELAKIPRKSGHEEKVSEYLYSWAKEKGFEVTKDKVNNVIIEKPADVGCENKPLTILQGHMDMVCIGETGYPYDPLVDPIKVINNNNETLVAYKTSLGADDGIGVAIAQYILTSGTGCGPLRVIFTVNEEELMLGAKEIEDKYLDAKYLINLDSENDTILTNSSAGGMCINLNKTPCSITPEFDTAFTFSITGLCGGHSGVEINSGRLNAIRAVCYSFLALEQNGIKYQLCSIEGEKADNAIPDACKAIFVIQSSDIERMKQIFQQIEKLLRDAYIYTEKRMQFIIDNTDMPLQVLSEEDKNGIITYATQIINGVHTMSPLVQGLVQSSSNLGILKANTEHIFFSVYWRSSEELFIEQMNAQNMALANMFGFSYHVKSRAPGWPINRESALEPLMTQIYEEQIGEKMKVEAIHAGLECSWFYAKNPNLDLVSVGPNLTGVHSPAETLQIASIPKTLNLVLETLRRL